MRKRLVLLSALLLTAPLGCSTISVQTDFDRETDFSAYKTYGWIEHKMTTGAGGLMNDPLVRKHIVSAIEREMAAKGFSKAAGGEPDFLIAYHIGARNRVDVEHYYYRYGRWGRRGGHDISVHRYKEGTLILDFVDRRAKDLFWRGWAVGVLHGRENISDDIDESVKKILERYPPR